MFKECGVLRGIKGVSVHRILTLSPTISTIISVHTHMSVTRSQTDCCIFGELIRSLSKGSPCQCRFFVSPRSFG